LASEERQRFRPRLRFGFSGSATSRTREEAGVDDFLDSLSRRSRLGSELDQETSVLMGNAEESIDPALQASEFGLSRPLKIGLGKIVVALTLIGGVVLLWVYGALGTLISPSAFDSLARSGEVASVFSDPFKLGLVALVSFVPVFLLRRRHHAEERLVYR
jgi:hypothetical protein